MPLDPHAKRFLDRLAALNPPSALSLTVAQRRTALQDLLAFSGIAAPVGAVTDIVLPGPVTALRVRVYTPAQAPEGPLPALVYFHGGGLVAGSLDSHDGICRSLCRASACRILAVDYRLAPEHRFPAAITDCIAATLFIARHATELGVDAARLGVCGDSAGATLAAVVAQHLARQGDIAVALQVLLCPITDLAAQSASRHQFATGYLLDEATLEHDLQHYLDQDACAADPRVSPLRAASLAGLAPACLHTAEFDPLRDEGRRYADGLLQAGVPTRYTCHPGMIHLFYGMEKLIPSAASAWQLIGSDIRAILAAATASRATQ
jgi:acetyl esterase